MTRIDHLILNTNDLAASVDFYTNILGFTNEGQDGPFTVIRVSEDFALQLAPFGTKGNEHYAFAMSRADFDRTDVRSYKGKTDPVRRFIQQYRYKHRSRKRNRRSRTGADDIYVRSKSPLDRNKNI